MDRLSNLIDPRFLAPLAKALGTGPQSEYEFHSKFLRDVPIKRVSQRLLRLLLECTRRGGMVSFERGQWSMGAERDIGAAVNRCLDSWCAPDFTQDELFRHRCAVCLDRGSLSNYSAYSTLTELSGRSALTDVEWARLISGLFDLRLLTGECSRHADAECLMLYQSADSVPVTDDSDVLPRIPRSMLTCLPSSPEALLSGVQSARVAWRQQVGMFLADVAIDDFAGFAVYAKDMLDLLLWGVSRPLCSHVSEDKLSQVSEMLQRFGLRAEDLTTVWRCFPSTYRVVTRLSWGVRYLSNNLSHPEPPAPDPGAFSRVCGLPPAKQSAISTSRSGHSLLTIIRPLRVLHRALSGWSGRSAVASDAQACVAAVAVDMGEDKLLRREFAERIKRLNIVSAANILDALVSEIRSPEFPIYKDEALLSAGLMANLTKFFKSLEGRAYAEVRLALHAELDFRCRFNVHSLEIPKRYAGIWKSTIQELVARLEDTRKTSIRSYFPDGTTPP